MTQPLARAPRALLAAFFCAWLAGDAHAQAPKADAEDWSKHVEKACTSPRYGLRLAAAKKVAQGGDAAIPAVLAWTEKNGVNTLPVALVEAIADSGGDGQLQLDALGSPRPSKTPGCSSMRCTRGRSTATSTGARRHCAASRCARARMRRCARSSRRCLRSSSRTRRG